MTTDETLSSADVLRGQLADILIDVPAITLAKLTDREKFIVFDWIETAKERSARQQHVPLCEVALIRKWMRAEQLSGTWLAFTTWRPSVKPKQQRGLFA